jgi:ankyrin repeat protein
VANERYKIIKTTEHKKWLAGCPVRIEKSQLVFDNHNDKVILQLKLFNLSDKIIKSIFMDIDCFDDALDFLSSIKDFAIQGVDALPQSHFGEHQPIILESSKTTNVKIIISKVVFVGGSVWRNDEKNPGINLPEQKIIDPQDQLFVQIARECNEKGIKPNYWLEENDDYWRCTCGQPNTNDVLQCGYCKANKEWLKQHLDKDYLSEANARFKEAEEIRLEELQKQTAAKKQKVSKLIKIVATVCVICLVAAISIGKITDNTYSYKYYRLKQLNAYDEQGNTQLISAIVNNDNETAKTLIEKGVDLNKGTRKVNNTPLMEASLLGNFEIAEKLLEHGANINLKNNKGRTALIMAVEEEQYELAELLVEHKADLNVLFFDEDTGQGKSALIIAAEKGNIDIAKLLIEYGATNVSDGDYTALMAATQKRHKDMVAMLEDKEPDMADYFKTYIYDEKNNEKEVLSIYTFLLSDEQGVVYNVHIVSDNLKRKFVNAEEISGRAEPGDELISGNFQAAIKKITDDKLQVQEVRLFPDDYQECEFNKNREMVYVIKSTYKGQPDILVVTQYLASIYEGAKMFYVSGGKLRELAYKWPNDAFNKDYIIIQPQHVKCVSPFHYKTADYDRMESAWHYRTWRLDLNSTKLILTDEQKIDYDDPQPEW